MIRLLRRLTDSPRSSGSHIGQAEVLCENAKHLDDMKETMMIFVFLQREGL